MTSAALLAAQERLMAIRLNDTGKTTPDYLTMPIDSKSESSGLSWSMRNTLSKLSSPQPKIIKNSYDLDFLTAAATTTPEATEEAAPIIHIYPSIAAAVRNAGNVSELRVWLVCREFDTKGSGLIDLQGLRNLIEEKKLITWRRLRQIINSGHDKFWAAEKDHNRLRLFSPARVAHKFNVVTLGPRVVIPNDSIWGSVADLKAQIYAAFHAQSKKSGSPISRATISETTNVPRTSQKRYERMTGISKRKNIAILPERPTQSARQTLSSNQGHAIFNFYDHSGKHGKPTNRYMAQRLPNSYHTPKNTFRANRGTQRKQREQLNILVDLMEPEKRLEARRIFFESPKEAARSAMSGNNVFWRDQAKTRTTFWYKVGIEA